ncbi:MAG: (d)CMP kinase [Lachnospiraceae bacterium]|nr:(d)CMP kinase [Lachnospiraceae bacterium]
MSYNIAIDGPAGAGKSSVAKEVAKKKGFIYVDTGAMYRAMALYLLRKGTDLSDAAAIAEDCQGADISLKYEDGVQCVILNSENVNGLIRTAEVTAASSKSAAVPELRKKLVELQQAIAKEKDVVMDGRDIGSVVLPDADLKIYLTASSEERARRRYKELLEKGEERDLEVLKAEIEERDYMDMHREESPLVQVEDAVYLDTSDMSFDEVVEKILGLIWNL